MPGRTADKINTVNKPVRIVLDTRDVSASRTDWVEKSGTLMAWAVRAETRQATYIGALSRAETGLACTCVCPACGGTLQAVNAGMPAEHFLKPDSMRPFFRHHTGQQQAECLVKVAQIAALQLLMNSQEIDLPAPLARRSVVGASGAIYTHEAVGSAAQARIADRHWVDEHAARITLEDGRVILIRLTGSNVGDDDGQADAIISIKVDDPEVSTWPPEKILRHAQLDGQWLCWERHWDDGVLEAEALAKAEEEARRLVDLAPEGYLMPDGLTPMQRSESVLHWVIKEMLAAAGQLLTPAVHEVITQRMPNGRDEKRAVSIPAMTLELSDVRVEYNLGGMVPDVMCRAVDSATRFAPMELMIEVAVTHRVSDTKRAQVQERGLGCIEFDIDLVNVGGRMTTARLKSMVLGDPTNKRWINHPELQRQRARALEGLAIASAQIEEELIQSQRRTDWFRGIPVAHALQEYLGALRESWLGRTCVAGDGSAWRPEEMAALLKERGVKQLGDREFSGAGGILRRLDRIRAAALASRPAALSYEALRSALEGQGDERRFASLILLAVHAYRPSMADPDAAALAACREQITQSIRDGETAFARPSTWDEVLGTLFPEMARGLSQEFGTTAYADKVRRANREAQRLADAETRDVEAARRAQAQEKLNAKALSDEIEAALDSIPARLIWAEMDGSIPMDVATAVRFVRDWRTRSAPSSAERDRDVVESAWEARAKGLSIRAWIETRKPGDAGEVRQLSRLLEASWLAYSSR